MPYSMQLTEQIPNDPPRMGAKSTTTSNHPSTPPPLCKSPVRTPTVVKHQWCKECTPHSVWEPKVRLITVGQVHQTVHEQPLATLR